MLPPKGCGALVDLSNNTGDSIGPASASLNGTFSAELTTAEVVRVIDSHPTAADDPIFLYVAYVAAFWTPAQPRD